MMGKYGGQDFKLCLFVNHISPAAYFPPDSPPDSHKGGGGGGGFAKFINLHRISSTKFGIRGWPLEMIGEVRYFSAVGNLSSPL